MGRFLIMRKEDNEGLSAKPESAPGTRNFGPGAITRARCARVIALGLAAMCAVLVFAPLKASAEGEQGGEYLNIATVDNRPISVDRLLSVALSDIDYNSNFTIFPMDTGFALANSGEQDGVIASRPDIEKTYTNLRKVPVAFEQTYISAFTRSESGLRIRSWSGLAGKRVGVLSHRSYTAGRIPDDVEVRVEENVKSLLESLTSGKIDVAVFDRRSHEDLSIPEGVEISGNMDMLKEYLYVNKNKEHLIPNISDALKALLDDGRGERILSDLPLPEMNHHKTILHLVSTNNEVPREDLFYAELKERLRDNDSLDWYSLSLNSRRFTYPNRLTSLAHLLRQDCVSKNVSAIVVSGEDALKFLSDYYLLYFRNTPVIFYGTESDYESDIRDFKDNFTGVMETLSVDEVAYLALELFPGTKNFFVINDHTVEGRNYRAAAELQLSGFAGKVNIEYNENESRYTLMSKIKSLSEDTVVLTGSYFRDASGQYYSQNEMRRLFEENCEVPVFTFYSMTPGFDAVGGKVPDYSVYGNAVAEMLGRLLGGVDIRELPPVLDASGYNRWVFDKNVMERWKLPESALPADSVIVNKIPSIWESDPRFAFTLVALLVVSIIAIIGVNAVILKYRRQQENLRTAEQMILKDAKLREVKERLERIINTAPVSFLLSVNDVIAEVNNYAREHLGIEPGTPAVKCYADPSQRGHMVELASMQTPLENNIVRYNLADGTSHRFLANFSSIEYEGQAAYISWAMDIEEDEKFKDQLQDAQMNLQMILDTMPVPVSMVDAETMNMVYGNEAYLKLFECDSLEELNKLSVTDAVIPIQADGTKARELCERLVHTQEPQITDIQCPTSKGKVVDIRIITRPIEYRGRLSTIGIMTDLAKEKELETSRYNLQTVLDMLPVAVRIADIETGEITYANNASLEIFGCASLEDIGSRSAFDFMPEFQPDGRKTADIVTGMNQSLRASEELQCFKLAGEPFYTRITSCVIDYKGRISSLAIIEDLTAEREYQSMLLSAADKEREANQLKGRFLVNMSHEIRTPMNAIIGLTEIELRKNPERETEDVYRKINNSAKHLLQIINDILDLSKIEADKIELFEDEFELEEVISSALLVASPRLDGKDVEFLLNASMELPRFVIGDRTRLWQILKNFLDNSAKYTEKGKIILSVFEKTDLSGDDAICVAFSIEDTGIGISEEQMKKLFVPYKQFYSEAQKKYAGTGLGMAISKQLCELMGGSMKVESSPGVGTSILITIPFKRSNNAEKGLDALKSPVLSGANILAVDDDSVSLDIMLNLLKGSGARCASANGGAEAMEIILEHRDRGKSFDLILLDYMMDGLNGLETARQIQTSLSQSPKLLMVTSYQRMLLKDDLDKNGICDIIEKPFIPSRFINKVSLALGYDDGSSIDQEDRLQGFSGVHVLLCEDYRLNQEVALGMLSQFGITATVAENGAQGVEILRSGKEFDLIFMDLQMPVMDGYEATRLIRADHRFDHIPVISLTADAMTEIVGKCLETGMNDHVSKPIEFSRLTEIFMKWLPESKRISEETAKRAETNYQNEGLMRFGGNRELYEKSLIEFAGDLPAEWPDFDEALKDAEKVRREVHKLKGAAGNLDLKDIYDSTVRFENSLRAEAPDRDMYSRLAEACTRFKKSISGKKRGAAQRSNSVRSAEELSEQLDRLEKALQSFEPKACVEIVKDMQGKTWPAPEGKLEYLYESALNYDFDAALEILGEIRGM